jgi:hypothetical protein
MSAAEALVALAGIGVAVVFIGCVTSIILAWIRRGAGRTDNRELTREVAALREEVARLSERQGDVLLGMDTGMEQMERRLEARLKSRSSEREVEMISRRD